MSGHALEAKKRELGSLKNWLKWRTTLCILRYSKLLDRFKIVFCNQEETVLSLRNSLPALEPKCRLVFDPWIKRATAEKGALRNQYGLPEGRLIFLHAGSSREGKGFEDLVKAFKGLKKSDRAQALLLRVGEGTYKSPSLRAELQDLLEDGGAIEIDQYVAAQDFANYIACSDCVVLRYRFHKGPSGVLSAGIGVGVDVIASDYDYLGNAIKEWQCGLLYEHLSIAALTRLLSSYIDEQPKFDFTEIQSLLTPENYRETIKNSLNEVLCFRD